MRRTFLEETNNFADWSADRCQNHSTWNNCPPDQAAKNPSEEEKKKDKSVADRETTIDYKEKESQEPQLDSHKEFETLHNNELDTGWQKCQYWGTLRQKS